MRSNYKRLGDYIRQVDVRNRDLKVTKLMGVSIQKVIMPSIANIVGTDMSTYKVVNRNQFVYGPVTSRNGDKVSIALFTEDIGIVSQAYTSFEIIDTTELLPEYLMLWFMRPEFDRYARFMSHGSAREIFGWDEMCDVTLPVPDIKVQQQIVDEYNTVKKRIDLNERLIKTLEETAQAVYKQWFVDFDFPDESGNPYKSSGGKMIDSELGEIPDGWRVGTLVDVSLDTICGKTPPTNDRENYGDYMPFLTIPDMHDKYFSDSCERWLSKKGVNTQKNKTLPPNTICVSCIGTAGLSVLTSTECQTNQQINSIICKKDVSYYFVFLALRMLKKTIQEFGSAGSVGNNMNKTDFEKLKIIIPCETIQMVFQQQIVDVFLSILTLQKQKVQFLKILDLLLSKLSTVEG